MGYFIWYGCELNINLMIPEYMYVRLEYPNTDSCAQSIHERENQLAQQKWQKWHSS